MNLRSNLISAAKKTPAARSVVAYVRSRFQPKRDDYDQLESRSDEELLAVMRHEAHRIEKSMYNNIFESRHADYVRKRDRIITCLRLLEKRGTNVAEDPTVRWVKEIVDSFEDLNVFINKHSRKPADYTPAGAEEFVSFVRKRRSVRKWASEQPPTSELLTIAHQMIDAARWAPTSGNRQPWNFSILTDPDEKELLRGIKEEHCISSPLLIFTCMDQRLYGALGEDESSLYIDAGAAIMQMVLTAHNCGLGVCWNHFALDMIRSRSSNVSIYRRFANHLGIPDTLLPIAIVAIGRPEFIPPEPARRSIDDILIQPTR